MIDAAQAVTLAALGAHAALTLHANGGITALTISDTQAALNAAAASITALGLDGSVTVIPQTSTDRSILTASAAAALVTSGVNPASETLSVADSGAALTAVRQWNFRQGIRNYHRDHRQFCRQHGGVPGSHPAFRRGQHRAARRQRDRQHRAGCRARRPARLQPRNGVTLVVQDIISNILAAAATLGASALGTSPPASRPRIRDRLRRRCSDTGNAERFPCTAMFSISRIPRRTWRRRQRQPSRWRSASAWRATPASPSGRGAVRRDGQEFSPNGSFILIADTAAALDTLATTPATLSR